MPFTGRKEMCLTGDVTVKDEEFKSCFWKVFPGYLHKGGQMIFTKEDKQQMMPKLLFKWCMTTTIKLQNHAVLNTKAISILITLSCQASNRYNMPEH